MFLGCHPFLDSLLPFQSEAACEKRLHLKDGCKHLFCTFGLILQL